MSIALDAMGGDHAPEEIVAGALLAAPQLRCKLYLVGDISRIQPLLPSTVPSNIELRAASQTVGMDEKPTEAFLKKKDASLMVAAQMVKQGEAKVMVSAGNTGAAATFSLMTWRRMSGVHRPAIASRLPNRHDGFVLLDAGASPDIDPEHIVEFAHMGRAYANKVMGRHNPKVHLLNIGEEEGKGNAFARQSYSLLQKYPWFAGNIEGKEMYTQQCDVVVCDAFVGNIVLKTSEGVADMISALIREQVPTNPIMRLLYWPLAVVRKNLKSRVDYAEYGGAPLLGLNGLCVIAHGRSNAKAICSALLMAQTAIENGLIEAIKENFQHDE